MRRTIQLVFIALFSVVPLSGAGQCGAGGNYCALGGGRLLDIDVHALVGGSYVTENYKDCFPEISDLNAGMGLAVGVGLGARFNLTRTFGLGTGINYISSRGTLDMAVTGQQSASISNVFQRSHYYAFDFPVYVSFSPCIANGVRWNFDIGLYYSYGTSGKQKNVIYDAKTNELGQLMTTRTVLETDYYKDGAFINSFKRADIGLHVDTGVTFLDRLRLGLRAHIGLKNVAKSTGLKNPSCHNINIMAVAGWRL